MENEEITVLAVESSAAPASCAIMRGDRIVASMMLHTGLTHSETLLPMIQQMLKTANFSLNDIDVLAVSAGPGSFTGVRIGVATVKGMSFVCGKPCSAVSTLAAMAENLRGVPFSGIICAAMDARRQQVYTALFSCENGVITRLTKDDALPVATVKEQLMKEHKPIVFVGDGAEICYAACRDELKNAVLAPAHLRYQQAVGVARLARKAAEQKELISGEALMPVYLRLSQAERELKAKTKEI